MALMLARICIGLQASMLALIATSLFVAGLALGADPPSDDLPGGEGRLVPDPVVEDEAEDPVFIAQAAQPPSLSRPSSSTQARSPFAARSSFPIAFAPPRSGF